MTDALSLGVVSIARTQRGRFFWAAWWQSAPRLSPFQKPDASGGGCNTEQEALAAARLASGQSLTLIEPYWAHACNRMLRGEPPPPKPAPREVAPTTGQRLGAWALLGVSPGASPEEIKKAYRRRALETHPDRGGDPDVFREVQRAYVRVTDKVRRDRAAARRPRKPDEP